jgi:hypothetical protein
MFAFDERLLQLSLVCCSAVQVAAALHLPTESALSDSNEARPTEHGWHKSGLLSHAKQLHECDWPRSDFAWSFRELTAAFDQFVLP